eukprot:gene2387-2949_t
MESENCFPAKIPESSYCDGNDPNSLCGIGSYCSSTKPSKCIAYIKKEGASCSKSDEICYPYSLECDRQTQKCKKVSYLGAMENCQTNSECVYPLICNNGFCSLPANFECRGDYTCPFGQGCFQEIDPNGVPQYVCKPKLKEGSTCTYNEECENFMICTFPSSTTLPQITTCQKINSKGLDDNCFPEITPNFETFFPRPECDVGKGLFCANPNGSAFAKCVSYSSMVTPSTFNCNQTNSDCSSSALELCTCNSSPNSGTCTPMYSLGTECQSYINEIVTCATKNRCHLFNTENSKTCMFRNCNQQLCQSNKCLNDPFKSIFSLYNEYLCKGITPNSPTSTSGSPTSASSSSSSTSSTPTPSPSENCNQETVPTRIPLGGLCNYNDPNSLCDIGSFCAQDGKCIAYIKVEGASCDQNSDKICYPSSLYCDMQTKQCKFNSFLGAMEKCQKNSECVDPLVCNEGFCSLPDCLECLADFTCPFGQACFEEVDHKGDSHFVCKPKLKEGQNCTYNDECENFMICTYPAKNTVQQIKSCHKLNSKVYNDNCLSEIRPNFLMEFFPRPECDVGKGLVCANPSDSNSAKCLLYTSLITPYTYNCNQTNSHCNSYSFELCTCNYSPNSGTCNPIYSIDTECQSYINEIVTCATKIRCHLFHPENSNTCLFKNCHQQLCKSSNQCLLNQFKPGYSLFKEYLCNGLTPNPQTSTGSPSSSTSSTSTTSTTSTSSTTPKPSNSNILSPIPLFTTVVLIFVFSIIHL